MAWAVCVTLACGLSQWCAAQNLVHACKLATGKRQDANETMAHVLAVVNNALNRTPGWTALKWSQQWTCKGDHAPEPPDCSSDSIVRVLAHSSTALDLALKDGVCLKAHCSTCGEQVRGWCCIPNTRVWLWLWLRRSHPTG